MLTVADRGEGGIKFAKILLTSYVNAPIAKIYSDNIVRSTDYEPSYIFPSCKLCSLFLTLIAIYSHA